MPLPAGRSERRKTGEHRPCLHTRLRLVKRSEPIFELVGRETAVGHVLAEDLRDPISIGVTGAEVARVRLARVANRCGRRRGRGQTQRLLAPRDSLGVPFALLRLLLLDERAAVELDFRPVHGVIAHRDDFSHACRRKRMAKRAARDLRGQAVLELHPQQVPAGARPPALDPSRVDRLLKHQRLGLRSVKAQLAPVEHVLPPLPV